MAGFRQINPFHPGFSSIAGFADQAKYRFKGQAEMGESMAQGRQGFSAFQR